jgi:alkanesulfonate monooxygenase SsuD/methylene tetrahydromethanopterin reductase-like flavin-dependent oxidoreductase (luciferase family)
MQRFDGSAPKQLQTLSSILDYHGYYSFLSVYHSKLPDYWIKIANIINPEHNLKYMIAIRTYAISPEYCAMMCEAFNEISPNRLILNVAAGDMKDDETSVTDVVAISNLLTTHEDRVKYTTEWLEKFTTLPILKNKPEIVVSGTSAGSISNANKYADGHLSMYLNYKNNLKNFIKTNKKIVLLTIIIRDSKEEAQDIHNLISEAEARSCLFGTENEIIEQIKDIEKEGVTDILVTGVEVDTEKYRIHRMVKRINDINR